MTNHWIRMTLASLVLAILLSVGLGVPLLSTFIAIGIIYVTHYAMTQMGTGATTVWTWIKSMGNVATGIVVFLAIRFLAAKALGLFPADNYRTLDDSGGLYWILLGHDVSSRILWEITFAMVAGQITVMWVNGTHKFPVRAIITGSLAILTLQIAYPSYMNSWATRDEVATNLENKGLVGAGANGLWVLLFGKPTPKQTAGGGHGSGQQQLLLPPPPETECTTPCSMPVGWGKKIKSGGLPISVRFHGKKNWIHLSGRGDDVFTLEQFSPGEAEFTSPNSTPVQVQIYPR